MRDCQNCIFKEKCNFKATTFESEHTGLMDSFSEKIKRLEDAKGDIRDKDIRIAEARKQFNYHQKLYEEEYIQHKIKCFVGSGEKHKSTIIQDIDKQKWQEKLKLWKTRNPKSVLT